MGSSRDLATDMKLILQEHSATSTHHYTKIHDPCLYILDFMDSEVDTNILKDYTATIFTRVQEEAVCIFDVLASNHLLTTCVTPCTKLMHITSVNLALKLGQSQRQGTNRVASVRKSTD